MIIKLTKAMKGHIFNKTKKNPGIQRTLLTNEFTILSPYETVTPVVTMGL